MARFGTDKNFAFFVEGIDEAADDLPTRQKINKMAAMAINHALREGRKLSAAAIRQQVNFPSSYLSDNSDRLRVRQTAKQNRLEGYITGRSRPTSLARFVSGTRSSGGVRVEVKPGRQKTMKRGFLMDLRSGNVGLAVRTEKGQKPSGAWKPVKLTGKRADRDKGDVWLLYGASVDQVFNEVRAEVAPEITDELEREFLRLMEQY